MGELTTVSVSPDVHRRIRKHIQEGEAIQRTIARALDAEDALRGGMAGPGSPPWCRICSPPEIVRAPAGSDLEPIDGLLEHVRRVHPGVIRGPRQK